MDWITRVNWVDLVVIIVVLRSTYAGSQIGFFGELFHIFGVCLAIIFGVHLYTPAGNFINKFLFIPLNIAYIVSFLAIGVVITLVFKCVFSLVQKIIKIEAFPAINKIGGQVLGVFEGLVLSIFIIFVMLLTPIGYVTKSAKEKSFLSPFFINAGASFYRNTAGLFGGVKNNELETILDGAKPLNFQQFRFKKKDKLDEILQ